MTDITTSDDNCVDGFTGDAEYMSRIFDDDSITRHWTVENNTEFDVIEPQTKAVQELDSELSDCDGGYRNTNDCSHSSSNNRIKRRKRVMLKNEQLSLKCDWINCEFEAVSVEKFVNHVSMHINELSVYLVENDTHLTEFYTCLWKSCDFNTNIAEEAKRHVNYHSYHTKLKSIGTNIKARIDLPTCLYGNNANANQIPDVLDPYKCNWLDCTYEGSCIQSFLFHVTAHVMGCSISYKCQWKGCGNNFANMNKLNCHIRIHSKEKMVACPDCGGMFASNTKFIDHCKRQLPVDLQGYQCAHCFKQYSSERILRDHMRSHINVHKCIYCDMTCANKFTLAAHIRFRHLRLRPFNCTSCDYRCETKQDLVNHLGTHDKKNRLSCQEANCNFSCKSRQALRKHVYQEHEGISFARIYECHECSKQFSRGVQLTYHLKSRHNLHWPSGHKRFSYRPDEDGKYKLQRIRYESLDATEQITSSKDINMSDEEDFIENGGDVGSRDNECDKKILITIDEENECGKKFIVQYSSVEPVDKLPDGATVLAECSGN